MPSNTNISYIRIGDKSSENDGRHATEARAFSSNSRDRLMVPGRGQNPNIENGGDAAVALLSTSPLLVTVDDDESIPSSFSATTKMTKSLDEDDTTSIIEVDLTNEDDTGKLTLCHKLKGILAILFSTILISLNSQILYYLFVDLKEPYSKSIFFAWVYIIYSAQNGTLLLFVLIKNYKSVVKPLKEDKRLWYLLVVRGLIGSMIQFVTSYAIDNFKKPAPASVITSIAPIFVYINAYICLKEKIGVIPILNVFIAIAGVLVMNINELKADHHTNTKSLVGTGLAGIAMFLLSLVTVVIRFLRNVHPLVINMAFGLGGILVQGMIVLIQHKHEYILEDRVVFGFCICSATITSIGNFFYSVSLKYESAGMVSLIRTSEIIFNFIFQFFLFGLQPDLYTAVGGGLVLTGVLCVTFRKIVGESSEHSKLRKYFWFLLY